MSRKVAIYARVSTEHEAQIAALDNQVQYYAELMARHPEFELYDRYIDEGITGTSVKKRPSFMRMMEDAAKGCFDLIITREVSRFARNTVDTLQETRKLKAMGVEVWFTEDNIWTMDDSDGELRLTIMATLAQNESKKTSQRVKAGQMISFKNGVPYGNGNVLGYDKLPNHGGYVINPEQAETVRMIFNLYLEGKGTRAIQYILEQRGRKTATGLSKWSCATIGRILKNPFYCGRVEYRKEYVPDYLEQKKVKNKGEVEKVIVKGSHEPIVSEVEFECVLQRITNNVLPSEGQKRVSGHKEHADVWGNKLVCSCGHKLNKIKYHRTKDGKMHYAYQCAGQVATGTVKTRERKGLPTDGICRSQFVQQWKLETQASIIFSHFFNDKESILNLANAMFEANGIVIGKKKAEEKELKKLNQEIDKAQERISKLLDLRLADEIDRDDYAKKRDELDKLIVQSQEKIKDIVRYQEIEDNIEERVLAMKKIIEEQNGYDFSKISDDIVKVFVDKIVVCENHLEWYIILDEVTRVNMNSEGQKRNNKMSLESITTLKSETQDRQLSLSRTRSNL